MKDDNTGKPKPTPFPVEIYTAERKAEYLLQKAVGEEVRKLVVDHDLVPYGRLAQPDMRALAGISKKKASNEP